MSVDFTARVTASDDEPYTTAELRGEHVVRSDEPDWLPVGGGDDDHPAPVDYLLSSLATCQVSVLIQALEANGVEQYDVECEATIDEYGVREDHPEELPSHTAGLIEHVTIEMAVETVPEYESVTKRCLARYDEGCIVGNSLREGIEHTSRARLELGE